MATPHINAERGDYADTVLMPGDPLRATYIVETFLDEVRQVKTVRSMAGVEMETASLYGVAAEFGARAAAICTVSDHIHKGDSLSSTERQSTFDEMMEIALESVLRDDAERGTMT